MQYTRIGLGLLLALGACGGGDGAAESTPAPDGAAPSDVAGDEGAGAANPPASPAPRSYREEPWSAALGTATVSGRVTFVGEPPVMAALDMSADPKCVAGGATDESILVEDGGLANVIVSVSKGLEGFTFEDGSGVVELEQRGCRYVPHVFGMQAGQTLRIVNRDDTVHNVHAYSKRNHAPGRARPSGVPYETKLSRKDKRFPIRCDMHSWMVCYTKVFDHPFFAVSDASGHFTLPELPAGTYTLTAEHEALGEQQLEVTVSDGATATGAFAFTK